MNGPGSVPTIEVGCVKDFPGTWAEYRVYETGESYSATERPVVLVRPESGASEEHFFNIGYQPLRDASGAVYAVASVAYDVTEQVRARLDIELAREFAEEARREAEEANQAKGAFLTMMSHELRTPLNAVTGYSDLLLIGVRGDLTEGQREDVQRIKRSGQYLLGLINDMLNFAKLEAGQVEFRLADVAVTPRSAVLVLDSAGRRIFSAAAKGRRLELALPLEVQGPTSLAPQSDSIVYVAHAGGIVRADLAARRARPLAAAKSIDLTGFTRLRWHRDSLIGIQRAGDNNYRVVRLTLDPQGTRVTARTVLDQSQQMPDPTAASLTGDTFYYLAGGPSSALRAETIVRKVRVR